MEHLSIIEITNPSNSKQSLSITMNRPIQSESQFLCDVIQTPRFSVDELMISVQRAFDQVCRLGSKEDTKFFWDQLNKLSNDNLDSIDNFVDYIKNIQKIGSFSTFIPTLPLPTLRAIIFTLVKRSNPNNVLLILL